jgi:hypothetical protein
VDREERAEDPDQVHDRILALELDAPIAAAREALDVLASIASSPPRPAFRAR